MPKQNESITLVDSSGKEYVFNVTSVQTDFQGYRSGPGMCPGPPIMAEFKTASLTDNSNNLK